MEFTVLRKLTPKDILGHPNLKVWWKETVKAKPGLKILNVFKIGGFINRSEQVPGIDDKPTTRFIGDFVAFNILTGEVFKSNRMFLPSIVSDELEAALITTKAKDANGIVEFGHLISMIPDVKSATDYVYVAEPLVRPRESDAMAALVQLMTGKALPPTEERKALPPVEQRAPAAKPTSRPQPATADKTR